jgi:hypothetical protein
MTHVAGFLLLVLLSSLSLPKKGIPLGAKEGAAGGGVSLSAVCQCPGFTARQCFSPAYLRSSSFVTPRDAR